MVVVLRLLPRLETLLGLGYSREALLRAPITALGVAVKVVIPAHQLVNMMGIGHGRTMQHHIM